jgi:hypothetical protein
MGFSLWSDASYPVFCLVIETSKFEIITNKTKELCCLDMILSFILENQ